MNFYFFIGTGLSASYEPYTYTSSYLSDKSEVFKISWTSELGTKYRLGKHLLAVADCILFVPVFVSSEYESSNYKNSGGDSIEFLPKIGLAYQF